MEWLKFAFDTLVIGALALPWLWLFMRIFFQHGTSDQDQLKFPFISALAQSTRDTIAGVLIVAIGYFLGCAVSRISSDFFDDADVLQVPPNLVLPNQSSIQKGVYLHEYCDAHSVLIAMGLPWGSSETSGGKVIFCRDEQLGSLVAEFFRLQEGKLLLEGEEKVGRLRELHDQIEVLRGATLNGVILFTLSWFGLCALYRARLDKQAADPERGNSGNAKAGWWSGTCNFTENVKGERKIWSSKQRMLLKFLSYAPAVLYLLIGTWDMSQHFACQQGFLYCFSEPVPLPLPPPPPPVPGESTPAMDLSPPTSNPYEAHTDPPLAEAVIILLGGGGLFLRLTDDNPRLFRNVCLMALVLTLIAYGSWWWTEVLYDQQVIHSFPTYLHKLSAG